MYDLIYVILKYFYYILSKTTLLFHSYIFHIIYSQISSTRSFHTGIKSSRKTLHICRVSDITLLEHKVTYNPANFARSKPLRHYQRRHAFLFPCQDSLNCFSRNPHGIVFDSQLVLSSSLPWTDHAPTFTGPHMQMNLSIHHLTSTRTANQIVSPTSSELDTRLQHVLHNGVGQGHACAKFKALPNNIRRW